jgi:hypothetical protein
METSVLDELHSLDPLHGDPLHDNDGWPDLIVDYPGKSGVSPYQNTGDGSFTGATDAIAPGRIARFHSGCGHPVHWL